MELTNQTVTNQTVTDQTVTLHKAVNCTFTHPEVTCTISTAVDCTFPRSAILKIDNAVNCQIGSTFLNGKISWVGAGRTSIVNSSGNKITTRRFGKDGGTYVEAGGVHISNCHNSTITRRIVGGSGESGVNIANCTNVTFTQ